jgi:hypothetical protein
MASSIFKDMRFDTANKIMAIGMELFPKFPIDIPIRINKLEFQVKVERKCVYGERIS